MSRYGFVQQGLQYDGSDLGNGLINQVVERNKSKINKGKWLITFQDEGNEGSI